MKRFLIVVLALLLVLLLCLAVACNDTQPTPPTPTPTPTPDDGKKDYEKDLDIEPNPNAPSQPYSIARAEDERQVVFFWREKGHDYADNDMWIWQPNKDGQVKRFHPCAYGGVVIVNVPQDTSSVGFIVRKGSNSAENDTSWGNASKVYDGDRTVELNGDVTVVYLTGSNPCLFSSDDGGVTLKLDKQITTLTIDSFTEISYALNSDATFTSVEQFTVKCDGQKVQVKSVSSLNKQTNAIEFAEEFMKLVYDMII